MISIFLGHDSTIFKTGENLASGHTSKRETLRNNETFINQYLVGLCGAGRNRTNILGWLVDGGLGGWWGDLVSLVVEQKVGSWYSPVCCCCLPCGASYQKPPNQHSLPAAVPP